MKKWTIIAIIIFTTSLAYYINRQPQTQPPLTLTIAAASDLKYAMDDIVADFKKQHPEIKIEVIMGSSGKFYHQIQNGAPFDIYFSADIAYPQKLQQQQLTASKVWAYAIGRIVLWSTTRDASQISLPELTNETITKIAIANPQHAPYGKRAQEALEYAGIWNKLTDKLVFGENIAQTANFAYSGAADMGIIALSLALSPNLQKQIKGDYYLIPDNFHQPLKQGYVILKPAANNPAAITFSKYVRSDAARQVFIKYGFVLPHV